MAAAATDLFKKLTNNFSTTLSGAIVGAGDTSMSLGSTTNLASDTGIVLVVDRVNASGVATPLLREYIKGTVSGSTIINLVRGVGNSTAQAHLSGAVVEQVVDQNTINDISNGILVHANQDGTIKANSVSAAQIANNTITSTQLATSGLNLPPAMFNPYKFGVYSGVDLSLSASTWTKVNLSVKEFDTSNNFDATTNYRFTAPIAGFYQIDAQALIGTSGFATTAFVQAAIYKNGVVFRYSMTLQGSGSAALIARLPMVTMMQLAANDYVELYAYCSEISRNVGGGQSGTYMNGFLVSAT